MKLVFIKVSQTVSGGLIITFIWEFPMPLFTKLGSFSKPIIQETECQKKGKVLQ